MSDLPTALQHSPQSRKSSSLPDLRILPSRRSSWRTCALASFFVFLSFFLLSLAFPYQKWFSSHRITHFLGRIPGREDHSDIAIGNNTTQLLSCLSAKSSLYNLTSPTADLPTILRDYSAWHKTQRACFVDPKCKQKPKLLVLRCQSRYCLGLGDRMRGVLFSLLYAIVMKRLYIIVWPEEPFPLQVAFEPASIDWTPPVGFSLNHRWPYLRVIYCCIQPDPDCSCGQPELTLFGDADVNATDINIYTDNLEAIFGHYDFISVTPKFRRRYYDKKNIHTRDILYGLGNTTEDVETMESAVFRTLFKPSNRVMRKIESVTFGEEKPYYGVHLRTGIDLNETEEKRFYYINNNLNLTIQSILHCLEVAGGKNRSGRVFLAADSTKAKEFFVDQGRQRGFRVKTFREETIHYVKVNFLEPEVLDDDALCDRFLTVFADLYMLSRSRILVSTGSHFADFANLLSGNRELRHILFTPELERDPGVICKPVGEVF